MDLPLRDGNELLDGFIRVLHTPGHTPGSLCLHFPRLRLLLVGDALNHRRGAIRGPSAHFTADIAEARRSIRKLANLDVDSIGFGHRQALTRGAAEALAKYLDETGRGSG